MNSAAHDAPDVTQAIPRSSENAHLSLLEMMTPSPTEDPGVFVGIANPYGPIGLYGGHFLGQAVAAGLATVERPKLCNSFHSYFLKRGNSELPIEYRVHTLRNGRASDARSISAFQDGHEVFHMIASFKLTEQGHEHQPAAPAVAAADDLVRARQQRGELQFPFPPTMNEWCEMEWATPSFREFIPDRDPNLRIWMRGGEASMTDRERQVVLAYLSDGPIVFNSALPYGLPLETHRVTSLDHSVWFHRSVDTSQWMLFDQHSTAAADGRGMNRGEVFTEAGDLVLTVAQESMLREIPAS